MTNQLQRIFSEIPERYELVNHALTFGLDVVWRRSLAARAAALAHGAPRILDMCTGTGETAGYVKRRLGPEALVVGADFTLPMMIEGRGKGRGGIVFIAAEATALPFSDGSFDAVTISFATRNLNVTREDLIRAFREFRRVLKPGGVFLNLETSRPKRGFIRTPFHAYARFVVPRLGAFFSGSSGGYAYLSNTMRRFYGADELASILSDAGFSNVRFRRLFSGVVAIHEAIR